MMSDDNGSSGSQTAPPVGDDEKLNRRIHHYQYKSDEGCASSGAFTDDEMSVDRAAMRTAEDSLANLPGMGIAQFVTGFARELGQTVIPVPELFNRAHAEVRGKKTRSVAKRLAKASRVIVVPKARDVAATEQTPGTEQEPPPPSQ